MDTIELTLSIPKPDHDRYIAWLEDPATGFVQNDAELRAYIPTDRWSTVNQETLEARLTTDGYPDSLTVEVLAPKNWNELWEENLSPIRAGPFLVAPPSADLPADRNDATIVRLEPELSFGTGHHVTTRLALELLAETLEPGDHVLDVGTGTGILAIGACRAGATSAVAVDTNSKAVENARENVERNEVSDCVTVLEGSTDVVPDVKFDVIVMNITRRVVLKLLPELIHHLAPAGRLLLSGILNADRQSVRDAADSSGLRTEHQRSQDGWWAAGFSLRSNS